MKTIIINASPRKKWNTAEVLDAARKGAESVGSEVEYVNLYDLVFKGCRSCLICKRKDKTKGKCYWKDDLSPLIEKIFDSDALIIGSPIYFGQPTSEFRALVERLIFCIMSYDDGSSYYTGKVNVGIFYTMNAPLEFYEQSMKDSLSSTEFLFSFLNGEVISYPVCDTLQVHKYSEYNMAGFSQEAKEKQLILQFPNDLENAFEIAANLSKG
ncbi:flavodoxin family protein [Methanobrevibacter sp.]|uniref:flavodoxin family protein n=4 Tax=unclassified Methanobrevibacter TaxID=2638681 RepID=UPI0025DBE469|nr:flavodoxin family protein [Methanobrevibacter sp.]MEE0942175.1 flavodoxin family protein [Methanobrevibacter sp.]